MVREILRSAFFRRNPPKTAGREEFGREFVCKFLGLCGEARRQDILATATALTAKSIADAIRRFIVRNTSFSKKKAIHEMIVSGGGSRNATLVEILSKELTTFGARVRFSDEYGIPSEAKEAVAFAEESPWPGRSASRR